MGQGLEAVHVGHSGRATSKELILKYMTVKRGVIVVS